MKNLPVDLQLNCMQAQAANVTRHNLTQALHCMDLTLLGPQDTEQDIATLCTRADQGAWGYVAAVCVYPAFVAQAAALLADKPIAIATVINFPSGKGTPDHTAAATNAAIASGATEIDVVFNYETFLDGDIDTTRKLLESCRTACGTDILLKVILESAAFNDASSLAAAANLALECGADLLKTSTGKFSGGGASLEAASIMLDTIKSSGSNAGLKISGGVTTAADSVRYLQLASSMMGQDWVSPRNFRIGASSLLSDITKHLGGTAPSVTPTPGLY